MAIKLARVSFEDNSRNTTTIIPSHGVAPVLTRPAEVSNNTSVTTLLNNKPNDKDELLPACRIRVTNVMLVHLEVVESVGKLIPHEYLDLPDTCNHQDLHFAFEVRKDEKVRPQSWLADFNNRVANTYTIDNTTRIKRSYGRAKQGSPLSVVRRGDTTIRVSCVCDRATKRWLRYYKRGGDGPHVCIHHSSCNLTSRMSNAIYMSPHHKRYFVPSALPQLEAEKKNDTKLEICAIGSTERRKWQLMTPFFEDPLNEKKYFDKIRIRMLGKGGMPKLMRDFENKMEIEYKQLDDDRQFYAAIKACGVIILPIAKNDEGKMYRNYFKSPPDSEWKLSGSIPPIIAYQKPFVLPQELVELYQKELPMHLPHRGYDDETDTGFSEDLSSLLEELL